MRGIFSLLGKRIRLAVALSCVLISLLGFWYLLPHDPSPRSFSGLDILHDSPIETKGFVAMQIQKDSQDVDVSIKLQDWENVSRECRILEFHFPGRTTNHSYHIDIQSWDDPR